CKEGINDFFYFRSYTIFTYFYNYFFLLICLCCLSITWLPTSSMVCIHSFLHPSSYENDASHCLIFSTTLNFAERALRFISSSLSVGKIGFLDICLKGALNSSGIIGNPFGTGFSLLHF